MVVWMLERAVAMVLEPVYGVDFIDGSYGFRLNRNTRDVREVIRRNLMETEGGWLLDVEVRKYFDMVQHNCL